MVDRDRYSTRVPQEHSYRYFCSEQVPQYEVHLTALNQQGIYITSARSLSHAAVLSTWKYANNRYHAEMEKTQKNIPSFGRAKEIAPESRFEFFAISEKPLTLPRWIRSPSEHEFIFPYPLNPLDVMFTHQVLSYDTINMPPVSLIRNVLIKGQIYEFGNRKIPAQMQYRFNS